MNSTHRVTKKRIAEQLGLSISTVDRALNGRDNVKPDTRKRVLEAAEQLDYLVNRSASLLSRGTKVSLVVALPMYPDAFWGQVEKGVWEAYEELRDYRLNVEIIKMNDDVDCNVRDIRRLAQSAEYDGLALVASADEYIELIDSLIDDGKFVCTLNTDSPSSKRLFYVGCDYQNAGRLAAELMCKFVRASGVVALLTDSWTSLQSKQKIIGFREGLLDYPNVKMVGPLKIERSDVGGSLKALGPQLRELDGIYVSSAELESISKLGLDKSVVLIGHDMNPDIHRALKERTITASICQDPVRQGYQAVKKLFYHIAFGEHIDTRENITKLDVAMRENADFYL